MRLAAPHTGSIWRNSCNGIPAFQFNGDAFPRQQYPKQSDASVHQLK